MKLKETEQAVMTALMLSEGIVPIGESVHDIGRALAQLSPDEARKLKRKFRKVWRKLARKELAKDRRSTKDSRESNLKLRYGAGKVNPSRNDREKRKSLVQQHFYKNLVRPLLDKFENNTGRGGNKEPK